MREPLEDDFLGLINLYYPSFVRFITAIKAATNTVDDKFHSWYDSHPKSLNTTQIIVFEYCQV